MQSNGGVLDKSVSDNNKSQSKKGADKQSKTLNKYLKMFTDSWEYAEQNYHQRWEDNYKLFHNKNIQKPYGAIDTFVPMVNSTVNTIVAALFNSNPQIKYIPNHPDQESDTRVLNALYDDFSERDGWVQKNKINGRQGIITGNFCAFYEWQPDKNGGYVHKVIVPVRDMIIDPQATSYEDWRYVGRRFFADKEQLEKETIIDESTGKPVKRYSNLEQVTPQGRSQDEDDKRKKDQILGATAPGDDKMVELLEIWTDKKVVVIANRSVVIEERVNPHLKLAKALYDQRKLEHEINRVEQMQLTGEDIGEWDETFDEAEYSLLPFAHGRNYEDVSLVYGDSDVDNIADQQNLLNQLTSLNLEAILYQLFPERTLDPKYASYADDLNPGIGKVYPLPAGAMVWNNPPVVPNNALQERMVIKDEIRETASVSQVTKGIQASTANTATEIRATLGQADLRIQEKAQTLANDFFYQEAKIVLRLIQLYAPEDMYVRNVSDAGVSFDEVNPRVFLGDYTPMVKLDVLAKAERFEQQQAARDAYQIMIQDPSNNLQAAKRIMYSKMMPELTQEEINEIIGIVDNEPMQAPQSALEAVTEPQSEEMMQEVPAEQAEAPAQELTPFGDYL